MTSSYLNSLFKDPIPKYSHILGSYWGLSLRYTNWGDKIQPITGLNEYHYDLEIKKERGGERLVKKKKKSKRV